MARNREPILKTCRSLDISPTHLGSFKTSHRGAADMGGRRKKLSEYGVQLREKQRVKFVYGVLEKQFRLTFERASRMKGKAGENLLILLESRLDSVLYRLSYGNTRPHSRQLVTHGHVTVNGRRVNIPSYRVMPGDVIAISEKARTMQIFKDFAENAKAVPAWIDADYGNFTATFTRAPLREEIDLPVNENLIVELYNK